jgi:hypothetical protein
MKHTDYRGYQQGDEIVQWFWKAVKGWPAEKKSRLLQFTTGTSRIPVNGFKDLQGSDGPRRFTVRPPSPSSPCSTRTDDVLLPDRKVGRGDSAPQDSHVLQPTRPSSLRIIRRVSTPVLPLPHLAAQSGIVEVHVLTPAVPPLVWSASCCSLSTRRLDLAPSERTTTVHLAPPTLSCSSPLLLVPPSFAIYAFLQVRHVRECHDLHGRWVQSSGILVCQAPVPAPNRPHLEVLRGRRLGLYQLRLSSHAGRTTPCPRYSQAREHCLRSTSGLCLDRRKGTNNFGPLALFRSLPSTSPLSPLPPPPSLHTMLINVFALVAALSALSASAASSERVVRPPIFLHRGGPPWQRPSPC